jgi:hypothetical protein
MSILTKRTILAGQPGTKKWIDKYGKDLICVRYKYDPVKQKKIKTVELIAEERSYKTKKDKIHNNKIVSIRVSYNETDLQRKVKSFGGKWNKDKKVWELAYKYIVELGLSDRLISDKKNVHY